jgi:hypothetical protein
MPYGLSLWRRTRLRAPLESRRFSNIGACQAQHDEPAWKVKKAVSNGHFRGATKLRPGRPGASHRKLCGSTSTIT